MRLEEKDVQEFIELWKAEFGEELSTEAAREHASRFLDLYELLARPLPIVPKQSVDTKPKIS